MSLFMFLCNEIVPVIGVKALNANLITLFNKKVFSPEY